MAQSPEIDLLTERYIMVQDYPQSNLNPYHIGDILERRGIHFTRIGPSPKSLLDNEIIKFPNIFRKLEWYQERKFEDLPKYVLMMGIGLVEAIEYTGGKIKGWVELSYRQGEKEDWAWLSENDTPATQEEYENSLK